MARELLVHYRNRTSNLGLIESARQIYDLFAPELEREYREVCVVVALDSKNYMLGWHRVSIGTINQTLVDARSVFFPALRMLAASIILIHNHPNADCEPSKEDYRLTKKLVRAGKLLGIPVFDHIVIGGNVYFSFKEEKKI